MATMEEKIKAALAHKDQGNEAFKQGDMKQGNKPTFSLLVLEEECICFWVLVKITEGLVLTLCFFFS